MPQRFSTRTVMVLAALLCVTSSPRAAATVRPAAMRADTAAAVRPTSSAAGPVLLAAAEDAGLRDEVLELALRARARVLAEGRSSSPILTVIDFSRPSRERRLWVLDVDRGTVLAHELVAHGRNTGGDVARSFSNDVGSYQSSLGTFVTGETYQGKHGLSLRLNGLDPELNSHAAERAIVVHGADYVNDAIVAQLGRLGRSEGCPALNPAVAPRIIRLIGGGTVLFAYYPAPELEPTLDS